MLQLMNNFLKKVFKVMLKKNNNLLKSGVIEENFRYVFNAVKKLILTHQ